jgi:cytochrome c-type biogenesis protein CcmE
MSGKTRKGIAAAAILVVMGGVTAVGAIVYQAQTAPVRPARTVAAVLKSPTLVGTRVKVFGAVVAGSWNKKSHPMVFVLAEERAAPDAPTLKVSYDGSAPRAFGDRAQVIVTGVLGKGGTLAADTMITRASGPYMTRSRP